MSDVPTTIAELDQFIKNQVQENLHLDYKASSAIDGSKRPEIAKDVSAFANSDGGMLIYGVIEKNNLPVSKDNGIDHTKYSREWLEQVISSNITPRIDGIHISPIQVSADRSYFVVKVPKSFRGPHQSSDNKYYKRFNFQSVSMEDYEINDVRSRRHVVRPLIEVGIGIRHRILIHLNVSNIGEQTAHNVTFNLPDRVRAWAEKEGARLFINGVKYFPPRRTFSFRLGHVPALLKEGDDTLSRFEIGVSYEHPDSERRISEMFHIDLMDFLGSFTGESEVYELGKTIKEAAKTLTAEVGKLNAHLSRLTPIAGATGLDLSVSSLKNLKHLLAGNEQFEKLNPAYLDYNVFMEVLDIDIQTAYRLSDFFNGGNSSDGLAELEGATQELIEKIKRHFILQESDPEVKASSKGI